MPCDPNSASATSPRLILKPGRGSTVLVLKKNLAATPPTPTAHDLVTMPTTAAGVLVLKEKPLYL
jgi:hypothetical protein